MSKKLNPKLFLGKERIYRPVSGYSRISRLYVWNRLKKLYEAPICGNSYLARRYELTSNGNTNRVTKYFRTLNEAIKWQNFTESKAAQASPTIMPRESPVSINSQGYNIWNLIEDFKKHKFPILKRGTQLIYLKSFPFFQSLYNLEVERLSPANIDDWLNLLKSDLSIYKNTRTSFAKEVEALKALLNWYISRTDNTSLKLPFKKRHEEMLIIKPKPKSKVKFMRNEEYQLWFETLKEVSPQFYIPAITQVNTILRVSEAFAMKWENYNQANGTYRVCEHVIWDRVKGSLPRIEPGTKNMKDGEYYDVPLRAVVIKLLDELRKTADHELIFHNEGKIWTYRQIQYAYNKAFKAAGLPFSSTHVCRHTGATDFLNTTGDPLALQQMGNWSDLKMAMHYGQILKSRAREAVKKADSQQEKEVLNFQKGNLKLVVSN